MHLLLYNVASLILCINWSSFTVAASDIHQLPLQSEENRQLKEKSAAATIPRIAIIGAGIAGASSAHHLHQMGRLHQRLDITVFEAGEQVGGRIRSVGVFGEPAADVEVGAAAFKEDDWCMKDAMQEVGLKRAPVLRADHTGVWDGEQFIVSYKDNEKPLTSTYWPALKWWWRYGSSLTKIRDSVLDIADKFSGFAYFQAFMNLQENLSEILGFDIIQPMPQCVFQRRGVSAEFINEVIRAESRYRHARDLDEVNVLSALLALRSDSNVAVYGGNQRLPHRMLKIAEADVRLNTRVTQITNGKQRRWKLSAESTDDPAESRPLSFESEFDIIILTAPFASSCISIDPTISTSALTTQIRPYVERHVTLFSTLRTLAFEYFNQSENNTIPQTILTAPARPVLEDGNDIFSITVADQVPPDDAGDCIDELEFVYKIVSSKPVHDRTIAALLGNRVDDSLEDTLEDDFPLEKVVDDMWSRESEGFPESSSETTWEDDAEKEPESNPDDYSLKDLGITWIHRQAWPHAYPQFDPQKPLLENFQIAPDLFYTAAGQEALSTMEMSCRMGNNVAKHLYYTKWAPDYDP